MSDSSTEETDKEIAEDDDRRNLDTQDSVDMSSQLSSAFTEDSLNSRSDKDKTSIAKTGQEDSHSGGRRSETSDTETDLPTTALLVQSPGSDHSSLERERQEDLEVFGLHQDMFSRYERKDENEDDEEEFFFDSDLNLEATVDDHIVAAELLRPERLDTVEEVSEPASESQLAASLPHDGVRWPEQPSQHTSLGTDHLASLTSLETEAEFSVAEMEFRNSFRSLDRSNVLRVHSANEKTGNVSADQSEGSLDRSQILRSQMSDDRSLKTRENVGKRVGLDPEELTYVKNPFEIFLKPQALTTSSSFSSQKVYVSCNFRIF